MVSQPQPDSGQRADVPVGDTDLTSEQRAADAEDLEESVRGLTRILAGSLSLEDLLTRVAESAVRAVPRADGAGVTMYTDTGRLDTVVASADFVRALDDIQYGLGEGPCVSAAAERRLVRSGSLGGESRWPRFGPRAGRLGVHSVLSLPLLLADEVLGAINVYAYAKDAFGEHAAVLGETFAAPAAVAVHNARVLAQTQRTAAQMRTALSSRATIDQAIGILRSRSGDSERDAFDKLRRMSQRDNVRLGTVAERLVQDAVRRARARHGGS